MKLAIASGKGGTGKTTLALAIAQVYSGSVQLLDCDVEAPNCHLFISEKSKITSDVNVMLPVVDQEACRGCKACVDFCQYNAMVSIKNEIVIFEDLCHHCRGCIQICPVNAIHEVPFKIGIIEDYQDQKFMFSRGVLDLGKSKAPPVIRALKKKSSSLVYMVIIDCPPGTSCPMTAAVEDADYVLLVTEPTPFGLHDLDLASKTLRKMKIPFGVILNRWDGRVSLIEDYCINEDIPLHLRIPEDRFIAVAYARGVNLLPSLPNFKTQINHLMSILKSQSGGGEI